MEFQNEHTTADTSWKSCDATQGSRQWTPRFEKASKGSITVDSVELGDSRAGFGQTRSQSSAREFNGHDIGGQILVGE